MKYLITESQVERIKNIIKKVAETYNTDVVVKTEVEVETDMDAEGELYYVIYPKFYVKEMKGPDFHLQRHLLAQYVEDTVGVPVHGRFARIKIIEQP